MPIVVEVSDTKYHYYDYIRALCDDLGLSDNIYFLGWRSNIRDWLVDFDLFVLSSKMETGPMALMEAMAMQVPFVTTHVGIVRHVKKIPEIGWVAPSESTAEFTDALQQALDASRRWPSIGCRAPGCAFECLSVAESGKKYYNVYSSLCNG